MLNSTSSSLTQRPVAASRQPNAFTPPSSKLQQAPRAGGQQLSSAPAQQVKIVKPVGSGGTAYENTSKSVLGRRLVRTFALAFAATWTITGVTVYLTGGFHLVPSVASSVSTFVASLVIFTLAVLPTLLLRKTLIKQPEPTTTSLVARATLLISQPATHQTIVTFLTCGVIQAFVWAVVTEVSKPEARLGIFASTTKHPFHLNERLILILLSNVSLGVTYACRELLSRAFVPKWPTDMLPLQGLIFDRLAYLPLSLTLPVVHSAAFTAVYLVIRRSVFRFILSWFGIIARPYIANFMRASHFPMDLRLFSRMVVLHSATVLSWEVGKAILTVYMVQPMRISQTSASPPRCLLEGIASETAYYRHQALFELSHLSLTSKQLRSSLFSDMSVSSLNGRTTWEEVWRSQMVILGKSYQKLLARGAPLSLPAASASAPTGSSSGQQQQQQPSFSGPSSLKPKSGESIFLNQRPVVPPMVSSILAAPPPPPPAPAPRAPAPPPAIHPTSQVPSIFTQHSLPPSEAPAPAPAPRRTVAQASGGVWALAQKTGRVAWSFVPADAREKVEEQLSWYRRVEGRELGRGLVRRSLGGVEAADAVLVMQTLSALISASLNEDPYGQVQRSIPRTLEALLSFLDALEIFADELQVTASRLSPVQKEQVRIIVLEEVGGVSDAAREAVRQIVETFGEHLGAFKMPVKVVKRLEALVNA